MPVGLHTFSLLGPGGQSGTTLYYVDANGVDYPAFAPHGLNVVPGPGVTSILACAALMTTKRRRRRP